jgi:hypothetical protein
MFFLKTFGPIKKSPNYFILFGPNVGEESKKKNLIK